MNTNHARQTRAYIALGALAGAVFISLYLFADAIKYGEKFEFYLGGMALADAIGLYAIAIVLFVWNAVTYKRPRYARHSR
jgi:hypothetical protein